MLPKKNNDSKRCLQAASIQPANTIQKFKAENRVRSAVVIQFCDQIVPVREQNGNPTLTIRESVCSLCEKLVCLKLDISLKAMRSDQILSGNCFGSTNSNVSCPYHV